MEHKKIVDVIGTFFLFVGFVLAFLPHALHARIGLSDSTSHLKHVVTGIFIVVIALLILIYNNRAFKFMK